jgi:hypothetical protein
MPQGSLTGRIVMEHLAKPWNNERAVLGQRSRRLFASAKIGGADLHVIASESSM